MYDRLPIIITLTSFVASMFAPNVISFLTLPGLLCLTAQCKAVFPYSNNIKFNQLTTYNKM